MTPNGIDASILQTGHRMRVDFSIRSIVVEHVMNVCCLQDLFQPVELQAMVVGNENYDWEELERVSDTTLVFNCRLLATSAFSLCSCGLLNRCGSIRLVWSSAP